jgi:hypothetical protein
VPLPGEQVQCDWWFPGQLVPDYNGVLRSFPVLVMVAAYSRFVAAMMIPSRTTGDLLAGMWQLLSRHVGAVPRTLLWHNESGIGQRGRLAEGVAGFCGMLGTRLIQARPYDPETKGLVERANGYLETSFLPGRSFVSAADFNNQLLDWLTAIANRRTHAITGLIPADVLAGTRWRWLGCRRSSLATSLANPLTVAIAAPAQCGGLYLRTQRHIGPRHGRHCRRHLSDCPAGRATLVIIPLRQRPPRVPDTPQAWAYLAPLVVAATTVAITG